MGSVKSILTADFDGGPNFQIIFGELYYLNIEILIFFDLSLLGKRKFSFKACLVREWNCSPGRVNLVDD